MNKLNLVEDFFFFNCPNCNEEIIVNKNELNCKIFRHAIFKDSYKQIDPHLQKIYCDKLVEEDKIFGCSKPFEIVRRDVKLYVVKCDYK